MSIFKLAKVGANYQIVICMSKWFPLSSKVGCSFWGLWIYTLRGFVKSSPGVRFGFAFVFLVYIVNITSQCWLLANNALLKSTWENYLILLEDLVTSDWQSSFNPFKCLLFFSGEKYSGQRSFWECSIAQCKFTSLLLELKIKIKQRLKVGNPLEQYCIYSFQTSLYAYKSSKGCKYKISETCIWNPCQVIAKKLLARFWDLYLKKDIKNLDQSGMGMWVLAPMLLSSGNMYSQSDSNSNSRNLGNFFKLQMGLAVLTYVWLWLFHMAIT